MITIITVSWIYHTITAKKELTETPPIGKLVEVNGHDMHVYAKGKGKNTIVFMSGGGTSSPTLDFQPLWSRLSSQYRIAVIEKAGYGWSEVADVSRDIDFILKETREALKLAGEKPPYVLAPHSMSGLEAIRWAQQYPDEVEAIIGLDPAIPESYQSMNLPSSFIQSIVAFTSRTGLLRLFPSVANSSAAIESDKLSADDQKTYRAIFHRRTLTKNMRVEVKQVQENAAKVDKEPIPTSTPMYFFISNGTDVEIPDWQEMLSSYTKQLENGNHLFLNSGHYVHELEPERIAKEIDAFLTSLDGES